MFALCSALSPTASRASVLRNHVTGSSLELVNRIMQKQSQRATAAELFYQIRIPNTVTPTNYALRSLATR